jgi:hypothetical protein
MKKHKYIVVILFCFTLQFSNAQGSDIIFMIDNSGSISNQEFTDMQTSIQSIIQDVLECNPDNRAAVVHYARQPVNSQVFIESNFTNSITTAQNFQRQYTGGGGDFHSAMLIVGDALDNVTNTGITSAQTQLIRNQNNNFLVFLFTDDIRNGLVNNGSPVGNSIAFNEFTNFKNNRGARFIVVHVPPNNNNATYIQSLEAAASIASLGGSYIGTQVGSQFATLETHPADPDTNMLPRSYHFVSDFQLPQQIIDEVSQDLCSITDDPCDVSTITNTITINQPNLVWSAPTGYTGNYFLEFIGSNDCPGGDIGSTTNTVQYTLSTSSINLLQVVNDLDRKCFRYRIRTDCSEWSNWCLLGASPETGPQFVQYSDCIPSNPCDNYSNFIDITDNVLSGTTIDYLTYVNIEASNTIQNGASSTFRASNSIILKTGFHAENSSNLKAYIDDCNYNIQPMTSTYYNDANDFPIGSRNHNKESNTRIKLFPNPTKEKLNISSTEEIVQWQLSNKFGKQLKISDIKIPSNQIELNLHDLPSDIYILKITLVNGDVITKKIIKN